MTATVEELREELSRHNRRVLGLAFLSAAAAVFFWALFYFLSYWLTLLAITVAGPMDVRMPEGFTMGFFMVAVGLCVVAAIGQWRHPHELPADHKPVGEIALDFLLAVPRMTLAVWGNLRAWQYLDRHELELGVRFLGALEHEQPIGMHRLPLHLPDPRTRSRVVLALQLIGFVETRRVDDELAFVLPRKAAVELPRAADIPLG